MLVEILGVLLVIIGSLGTVIPILPGSPVALVGFFLIAWQSNFERVGWVTLAVITVLTVLGLLFDVIATHYGVKKAGASRLGLWGAMIGVIFGIFFVPFGILLGPMIGAVVGELIHQQKLIRAGGIGLAAGISIIASMFVKLAFIGFSIVIFAWDYLA